jgi:hypothetical protein
MTKISKNKNLWQNTINLNFGLEKLC